MDDVLAGGAAPVVTRAMGYGLAAGFCGTGNGIAW